MPENIDEKLKRGKIEAALLSPNTTLSQWQEFAKSDYGLINGNIQANWTLQNHREIKRFHLQMIYDGMCGHVSLVSIRVVWNQHRTYKI